MIRTESYLLGSATKKSYSLDLVCGFGAMVWVSVAFGSHDTIGAYLLSI